MLAADAWWLLFLRCTCRYTTSEDPMTQMRRRDSIVFMQIYTMRSDSQN